jgi:AraC-like DNA-binding protein
MQLRSPNDMAPDPRHRTRVVRHASDLGRWEIAVGTPHPRMAEYVRGYWGYSDAGLRLTRRRKSPTGNATLIINFGPPFRLLASRRPDVPVQPRDAFVAGLHDSPVVIEATGDSHCVQVDLRPLGAFLVLGQPMEALTDQIVELEDILGPMARQLRAQLYDAGDWPSRFALLDATIAGRLGAARPPSAAVAWAWRELHRCDGRVSVGVLTEALGCSRQHLIRRFHEQVGLPPKRLARILRFNHVLRLLERGDAPDWAELALRCGYYDQAHLNRDFRHFAGCAPGDFLHRRLPDQGGVAAV